MGGDHVGDDLRRLLHLGAADVAVGDQADPPRPRGVGEDAAGLQRGGEAVAVPLRVGDLEEDHVGLHRLQVDPQAWHPIHGLAEPAGVGVVRRQPLDAGVQSHQPGGGEDARLAHATPQHLAVAARLVDVLPGARQDGADGGAQALGEAELHRVEGSTEYRRRPPRGDGGIEDAGAVQVGAGAVGVGQAAGRLHLILGQHRAAGAVVGVLQGEQGGVRVMDVLAPQGGGDGGQRRHALHAGEGPRLGLTDGGNATDLIEKTVGLGLADDLIAPVRVEHDGDLVALGAGGAEQGGLLADQRRRLRLQLIDRRVLAVDIVAYFGLEHRPAHLGRGPGYRVTAQINIVGQVREPPRVQHKAAAWQAAAVGDVRRG